MPINKFVSETGEFVVTIRTSKIEDVDRGMFFYIDEVLNLHTTTNKGFNKVPVIWVGSERSYQIKHDVDLRNKDGLLKLPIITVERMSINKDQSKRETVPANIPDFGIGGSIPVAKVLNSEKTALIARAKNLKKSGKDGQVGQTQANRPPTDYNVASMFDARPRHKRPDAVYTTYYMPIPVYVSVKYEIMIQTEYQQQMNELITPFINSFSKMGRNHRYFHIYSDGSQGHKYEAFIDGSYSMENNGASLQEEERKFTTKVSIDVMAYLIGGDTNEDSIILKGYENAVQVSLPREEIMTGQKHERVNKKGTNPFYKE
tara:strand:+ start:2000 stop:2947 length:948 start_codon:yes stop_codon:yes gene_type:complete